ALDTALDQLNATHSRGAGLPSFTLAPIQITGATFGTTITFTAQVYDRAALKGGSYNFATTGAPNGSMIDAITGAFSCAPTAPAPLAQHPRRYWPASTAISWRPTHAESAKRLEFAAVLCAGKPIWRTRPYKSAGQSV